MVQEFVLTSLIKDELIKPLGRQRSTRIDFNQSDKITINHSCRWTKLYKNGF